MAKTESIQPEPVCHNAKALTAIPTNEPVLFLNRAARAPDLAETAAHRLNAARRLLEVTAVWRIPEADATALNAVSEAAYVLLSDGVDLFNALAFPGTGKQANINSKP